MFEIPGLSSGPRPYCCQNSTNIQNANYEGVIVAWLTAITFFQKGDFSLRRMYWRTVTQTEGREGTIDWLVGLFVRIMQSVPMIYNKMNAVSRWLKFTYLRLSMWHDNFIRCHDDLYCRPKVTILSILCLQSDGIGLFLTRWEIFTQ